jgi:glucose-1-phosphate thymidylyltransferase
VEIAKALIIAGRLDQDRPWPSVGPGPKPLVPVANQPILFHHLESLRQAGLLEAMIAVPREEAAPIAAAVGDGSGWGLAVTYREWKAGTGVRGALAAAREFIADEPVLVEPADALHREHIHPHITTFASERLDAMALRVANPSPGVCEEPLDGGYMFSRRAIEMLLKGRDSALDPVGGIRRRGGLVRVQAIDGCLPCHGGQESLLEGNRRMLETLQGNADQALFPRCEFQGPVLVDPSAELEDTLIRGPAIIGPRTRLSHAYVGPYTSIGGDVRIEGSQIEYSIVLDGAQLLHVGTRLDASVIGYGARVRRMFSPMAGMRLSVGDGAEVSLS